jgi:DNA-binding transcriptional regulator PaaX
MHKHSAMIYLLKALLPYSRQNVLLNYKPRQFFYELARSSHYNETTLKTTFYRARKAGYVAGGEIPRLTRHGRQKLQPFIAEKLGPNARLMVIFDIPEHTAYLRRRFRAILRELEFTQVQQSVWMTSYDHREYIRETIKELELEDYVQLYEAAHLPL